MPEQETVLDSKKANLRKVGNAVVQTIPADWRRMSAFVQWFKGDLAIELCIIDGQKCLVIRRAVTHE